MAILGRVTILGFLAILDDHPGTPPPSFDFDSDAILYTAKKNTEKTPVIPISLYLFRMRLRARSDLISAVTNERTFETL